MNPVMNNCSVRDTDIKIIMVFILLFIPLYFSSCDILRSSPFEVLRWSPGEHYHADPHEIAVSLSFSHEPDRQSVERHFSMSEDNGSVKGVFLWEGKKMLFIPLAPLEKNRDFILTLSAEAKSTAGLSMDKGFTGCFTTRPASLRPFLVSFYPGMNEEIDDTRVEVNLIFSVPVSHGSLYDNVSFVPAKNGSWRLEDGGHRAIFTPFEPWAQHRRHELHVSASLAEIYGMSMGKDFISTFVTGTDHEDPVLVEAWRLTSGNSSVLLEAGTAGILGGSGTLIENRGWEKNDRLLLKFSKPVDSLSVNSCLSAEGAAGLVMDTAPLFNKDFIFSFETIPVYESRFTIRLKEGVKDFAGNESEDEYVFRIYANGSQSMPPVLAGIRLPMAPGSLTDPDLVSFDVNSLFEHLPVADGVNNFPSGEEVRTWIEFYFFTAPGASIDQFSFMELFRIDTSNNVLAFSPRQVKTGGFSVSQPAGEWQNLVRIELTGILVNSTNFGVVNFHIQSGLKDSYGNKNEKTFIVSLLK
ncbi:MAG: Ig-like domain-containing protein [Treponema sp.]|nr:Ig-like domain-containing protein [Treponema sp.]